MNLLKKIFLSEPTKDIPLEGYNEPETVVYAHSSLVVRWESRHGEFHGDTKPEVEIFPLKEDAEAFAESLRNAFRLIRHKSGTKVTISENK